MLSREKRRTITKANRAGKLAAAETVVAKRLACPDGIPAAPARAETAGAAKYLAKIAKEPRNHRFFL